jgi:hypothetical protein
MDELDGRDRSTLTHTSSSVWIKGIYAPEDWVLQGPRTRDNSSAGERLRPRLAHSYAKLC